MVPAVRNPFLRPAWVLLTILFVSACSKSPAASSGQTLPTGAEAISLEEPTVAEPPASPTPLPSPTPQLAAMVNGQPILLETFEKELARFEMAQAELGITPGADGEDFRRVVLDALIERELISQAARAAGISVTPELVEAKISELRQTANESGSFDDWLAANHWELEEFKEALGAEMLAEKMIAAITADVPDTAEQVRASYIQVDDADLAGSLLSQIKAGADFGDLAARYSRDSITAPGGGDLGYFARGSLLVPEVEEAAFQLQPEAVSDVISVADPDSGKLTYYIIKVNERDTGRPLNSSLRHQLLEERYTSWLNDHWSSATIVTFLD